MHSSSTRTIKTVEHFDQEGKLFKRVTTDTWDEFVDLDTDQPEAPDESPLADPPTEPYRFPTIQPFAPTITFPSMPKGWEVYCVNGANLDNPYPGRSAG